MKTIYLSSSDIEELRGGESVQVGEYLLVSEAEEEDFYE